jgi:GYF domain 2
VSVDWYYSVGHTRQGPVTEDALRRMARSGTLRPTDLVWREGMTDWVEASTVEVLFAPTRSFDAEPEIEDRPSRRRFDPEERRPRRDEFDDDDRPRIRRRADDLDDRDYDRPRRRRPQKPGQVQAVGIMMLVGGIMGVIVFLTFAATCVGLVWPGIYFELVVAILAIVRGANMLNQDDQGPPRTLAVLLIICIINLDVINCVLGIVSLVMLNDPQVRDYYRSKGFAG